MDRARVYGQLAILSVLGAFAPTTRAAGQTVAAGIRVFTGRNFRGSARTFQSDVPVLRAANLNDRIVSLRVAPGEQWEVCRDDNFRGPCITVSGDEPDLGRRMWANKISSIRRIRSAAGIIPPPAVPAGWNVDLFAFPSFRGRASNFTGVTPNLSAAAPRTRSVRIGQGVWQLCSGPNFTGQCVTLDRSTPRIGTTTLGFQVRSLRPVVRQAR